MKNKLKTAGVILFVITMIITACQKSDQTKPTDNEIEVEYDKLIVNKINSFRESLSSTFKSSSLLSIDTAIWNLEALITYDEAYPDSSSKDFMLKRSTFSLPIDQNNMVLEDDVESLYYEMLDTIDAQLAEFDENVKFLAFSDVALLEVVGGTAYVSATNGYGFNYLLGIYYPFDEDDDWYWGTLSEEYGVPPLGKCDGTQVGVSDGSNEIQYRLNHPIAVPIHTRYTDIVTIEVNGYDFEDIYGNPRLFWGWDYPNDECLTNDTLTYYLIQSDDIIKTPDSQGGLKPPGKSFISVYIDDDLAMSPQISWHYHRYEVTYGVPYTAIPD